MFFTGRGHVYQEYYVYKKSVIKRVKLISILICLCLFIIQVCIGCGENYTSSPNHKLGTQSKITNYIAENFDEYKSKIKEETGFEGKIVSEKVNGKDQKYIEFDIDDTTKIKFEVADVGVIITKKLAPTKELNWEREIEMLLIGMDKDDEVVITLSGNGSIHCNYNANDLEHPLPSQKEKDEGIDHQIKLNMSTEELKELSSKAHSIYNVFEEICKEYNEENKE